ncbi:ABC transporter substrate-binding protein, partial [bacterium]|nr:ABC transporter substrate-binding protein [bacterium]
MMKRTFCLLVTVLAVACLVAVPAAFAADKIVIGHAAALSGTHAKSGEQANAGIKAAVEWVNTTYGGVKVGGKKIPLEYKYYDMESKKETIAPLLQRLVTTDKVEFLVAPYSSGLTMAGAIVAERLGIIYLDHGGASDNIFEQGYEYIVQTIGPGSSYHAGTLEMVR